MSWARIHAVILKEWRLNLRHPIDYFAVTFANPIKTAAFMMLLYAGLLKGSTPAYGRLSKDNYQVYVLLGTTCHSLFNYALGAFRQKMILERWWQTITATLLSPANIFEVISGFMIGSAAVQLILSALLLVLIEVAFPVPMSALVPGIAALLLLMLFGFGLGLIGTTITICFEGDSWIFDNLVQVMTFASCFYYPIEILPRAVHPYIRILPTYQITQALQKLFLDGVSGSVIGSLIIPMILTTLVVVLPALLFDYSIKKFGITGY